MHHRDEISAGNKNPELERAVLACRENPSEEKLQALMEAATALVYHYAGFFCRRRGYRSNEWDDLVQVGFEGVLKSLKRFDPQRGVLFGTYASHFIMGEMRREIRRQKTYDRPAWMAELQGKILQVSEDILKETGEAPTLEQIAEAVNVEEEGVLQAMQAGRIPMEELDLSSIRSKRHENFQLPIEDKIMVRQALARLSELQRKAIYLLFYRDMTQQQVADQMGLSQRKVSRLKRLGLDKMSKYLS